MIRIVCLITGGFLFSSIHAQELKKIVLDPNDPYTGHYLVCEPEGPPRGVLLLLAGFGQRAEDAPPETRLHSIAATNGFLTVFYAAGNKMYLDSAAEAGMTRMIKDVMNRYHVKQNAFVLGGFSAGGMVVLRYTEKCYEGENSLPIKPAAVFTVDSPIDIFTIYRQLEKSIRDNYSEAAIEEAVRATRLIREDHGIPADNVAYYSKINAFSMDDTHVHNENVLVNVPVRVYHDVDIAWRISNRRQTVHGSNYEVTAELINRLVMLGNNRAEFMQSFKTGYRSNGQRHPHSWFIVDEKQLLEWMVKLLQ